MTRKSKQAGGHMPLTHYERTKKFASSEYGTTTTRLSSDSQTPFGHCCLNLTPITDPPASTNEEEKSSTTTTTTTAVAMVSPSGHLYSREAILEYLLTKQMEYQQRKDRQEEPDKKRLKLTATPSSSLQRTSYWLPDMQPQKPAHDSTTNIPRPSSPCSGEPLRRKDLKMVQFERDSDHIICAISGKPIRWQSSMAYWTKNKADDSNGVIVLKDVYDRTVVKTAADTKKPNKFLCPLTNAKIKQTISLNVGGSGFAANTSATTQVQIYRPTIT